MQNSIQKYVNSYVQYVWHMSYMHYMPIYAYAEYNKQCEE